MKHCMRCGVEFSMIAYDSSRWTNVYRCDGCKVEFRVPYMEGTRQMIVNTIFLDKEKSA